MRIEVVVDVKTTLAKARCGTSSSSASTGSTVSTAACSAATADGREIRCLGRAAEDRLDGAAQGRQRRGRLAAARLSSARFRDRRCRARSSIPSPTSRNNRLNDGKVDRRGRFVAGSMDTMEEGPNGALYRLDPDFSLHKLDDRHHRLQRSVLEPRRRAPSTSPTPGPARSGPTTTTIDTGARLQPAHLRQASTLARRRGRRLDGRCRGLPVERAGL